MKEKLKKMLDSRRFEHSMGVANEAVKLAGIYGVNEEKAYIAGLLHDCAKGYTINEQLNLCEKFHIELDEITRMCPAVIHAPLGAEIAKTEFGTDDEEILDAIRFHTVGGTDMTELMKIIYIADMTEPMRDFEGVEEIRKISYQNLDEAMLCALSKSMDFNLKKKRVIHPDTLRAWNDCLLHINTGK